MTNIPVDTIIERMEETLRIASDFTRLKILYCIAKGEKSVSEIMAEVGISQSLASHQLKVLREAYLVSTRKEGTKVYYQLADDHVIALLDVVYEHVTEE